MGGGEKLRYLFFGGVSFLLNLGCYAVFADGLSLHALTANLLAWILTVAFVYITNRKWVFGDERKRGAELIRQILAFYAGRTVTLFAEEAIVWFFAVYLGIPGMAVKAAAQFIVILLNYIISKKFIFRGRR